MPTLWSHEDPATPADETFEPIEATAWPDPSGSLMSVSDPDSNGEEGEPAPERAEATRSGS